MSITFTLLIWVLLIGFGTGWVDGRGSNGSMEHDIREILLSNYDKQVLPRGPKGKPLSVEFGLKVHRLTKVNNKEQLVSIDTWVVMKWHNEFLTWKKEDYGGRGRVTFSANEIWVPDIVLYNNGDERTPFAGGRSKFLTHVSASSDGENSWSSPASFKLTCDMALAVWPFDEQSCDMGFGSLSYGNHLLDIKPFKTRGPKTDKFLKSGDWDLKDVTSKIVETDHGNCCPFNYTEIRYTLKMARRFKYHMFYLVAPCLILAILSIIGFLIPSESGERIGFVTTLLLAMMVFLLLVPDALPESSKSIPILGIFMMSTLAMITAILLVTIVILNCYHTNGHPPNWIQKLFNPLSGSKPKTSPVVNMEMDPHPKLDSEASLRAVQPYASDGRHGGASPVFEEHPGMTYQELSVKLDKVFFWVFLIVAVVMFSIILNTRK